MFSSGLRPLLLFAERDSVAARAAAESLPQPSREAVAAYAALGDTARAMTMLEILARHPSLATRAWLMLPEMDPLRENPRFQALMIATQPARAP